MAVSGDPIDIDIASVEIYKDLCEGTMLWFDMFDTTHLPPDNHSSVLAYNYLTDSVWVHEAHAVRRDILGGTFFLTKEVFEAEYKDKSMNMCRCCSHWTYCPRKPTA